MRILPSSPLPLGRDSWTRDITALYRGFAELGHDAPCLRLYSKDGSNFPGVHQIGILEIHSSKWWKEQNCDLVVMNTWGMPQHTPMLVAAKNSGAKVVARLDTHGYKSPWCGFWPYLRVNFYYFREHHNSAIAAIKAFSKSLLYLYECIVKNFFQ